MTNDQLRAILRERPFRPFVVWMANGRSFAVPHPDYLTPEATGRSVAYTDSESGSSSVLDVFHIVEIERTPLGKKGNLPKMNGQPNNSSDDAE